MGVMDDIRTDAAACALSIAQELGVVLYVNAPGVASWVTVYGFILDNSKGNNDVETLSVVIPRQTGFPFTAGVPVGTVVKYNSLQYTVESAVPDIGDYQAAATFLLECQRAGVSGAGECDIGDVPA
jgi:hypothetical protein